MADWDNLTWRLIMSRKMRIARWLVVVAAGTMPAFVMRCDKAALNFQRGLFEGLGVSVSDLVVDSDFINIGNSDDNDSG